MMKQLNYTVRFLTPAFLGNAQQDGQWRTPPFKALLRQWWRVAYAAGSNFKVNVAEMRKEEGLLFGHAWLEDDYDDRGNKVAARKSRIRIRLSLWDEGRLGKKDWQGLAKAKHPEVPVPVGSDLYLGYGPLEYNRDSKATSLKKNAAIQAGEEAVFSLAFPEDHAAALETALWLMDRYGTLGGRSRNGWGSFSLTPASEQTPALRGTLPTRNWQEALGQDWPNALGADSQALIWQTSGQTDWKSVMVELAKIKIGLRTQFTFNSGKDATSPEKRHWLSYPVTKHSVKNWGNNARLPNSLRFKVRKDDAGKLRGVIFHMPCKPPAEFRPDLAALKDLWPQVHQYLDTHVSRIAQ